MISDQSLLLSTTVLNDREAIISENTEVNSLHFTEAQTYTSIEGTKLY